jgi:hypothetical protein
MIGALAYVTNFIVQSPTKSNGCPVTWEIRHSYGRNTVSHYRVRTGSANEAHSEPEESSLHALRPLLNISFCKQVNFPKQFQPQVSWPVPIRNYLQNYEPYWRPPVWSSGQRNWLQNGDELSFLWGTNLIYICYVEESRGTLYPQQLTLTSSASGCRSVGIVRSRTQAMEFSLV